MFTTKYGNYFRDSLKSEHRERAAPGWLVDELRDYAFTVSHELKNPLTGILAFAELLQTDWATPEMRQHAIHHIEKNGRKMQTIIHSYLTLAEMQEIDQIPCERLNMETLVNEALAQLQHLISDSGAQITVVGQLPAACGYAPWIEEVWVNILSNGLKYGGRPPWLQVGGDELANGMVRFWVKDNGPGLVAAEQARLFDSFCRLNRKTQITGHGLGLSIVQRIIHCHGGQVDVESEVGHGSQFFFTLTSNS